MLGCFLVGLVVSNSLIAVVSTFGFAGAWRRRKVYLAVSVVTAAFSLVIGTLFLTGRTTLLPTIFGG